MQLKMTETKTQPRLGKLVYTAPENWKISALWEANGKAMCAIYDNVSRRDSKIVVDGQVLKNQSGFEITFNAETIGQPLVWGAYVAAAGECGRLIYAFNGQVQEHYVVPLKWASACAVWGGVPVVINWTGQLNRILDCVCGQQIGLIPSTGIALSAIEFDGMLVAACADSDDKKHGLAFSDGRLIRAKACQCVVDFCRKLLYSSGNRVYWYTGEKSICLGELPCEKIMDMRVIMDNGGHLRIAGANPDSVWDVDPNGNVKTIGAITTGNATVGGSCFRVRASNTVFSRCRDGKTGEVYEIV